MNRQRFSTGVECQWFVVTVGVTDRTRVDQVVIIGCTLRMHGLRLDMLDAEFVLSVWFPLGTSNMHSQPYETNTSQPEG